jgi:hypothetical protein
MTTVEIHGRVSRWRLPLLMVLAGLIGVALGRGRDTRDWSLSWQSTKVTMIDPATGMTQTQEQSGSVESLTTPTPMTGKNPTLFGTPDE